ncbi:hypothetical protein KKC_14827, partial [Listeria fleischmannii subsp. coloradonensis]
FLKSPASFGFNGSHRNDLLTLCVPPFTPRGIRTFLLQISTYHLLSLKQKMSYYFLSTFSFMNLVVFYTIWEVFSSP